MSSFTRTIRIPQQLIEDTSKVGTIEMKELKMNEELRVKFNSSKANNELMPRKGTIEFFSMHNSTFWDWTKNEKVAAYGKRLRLYYKRSELLDGLTQLKVDGHVRK